MGIGDHSKGVFLFVTPYEHEKVLLENALLGANILFNIERPIPMKGSIAHPVPGPWSFYVRESDFSRAGEIIRTLPIENPAEVAPKMASPKERRENQIVFLFFLGLVLILLSIFVM